MKNKIINKKIASYFDGRGETYNRSWQSHAKKRLSHMETVLVEDAIQSIQEKHPNRAVKVLDVGIATGRIAEKILKYNVELYGIDVSSTMVTFCKDKFQGNKKVKEFIVHDILNQLPTSWGTFDVISAIRVLSYVKNWELEVQNIYKALNHEGILIFTFPNRYSPTLFSRFIHGKKYQGYEVSYQQLQEALEKIGFSEYKIVGFTRILDSVYDWSTSIFSTNILFAMEKLFTIILGPVIFTRLFYVICKK